MESPLGLAVIFTWHSFGGPVASELGRALVLQNPAVLSHPFLHVPPFPLCFMTLLHFPFVVQALGASGLPSQPKRLGW